MGRRGQAPREETRRTVLLQAVVVIGIILLAAACARPEGSPPSAPPAGSSTDVPLRVEARWTGSYARDVQPIFDQYCVRCHGREKAENGLRLDSYEGVLAGTQFGPVVRPGAPGASTLVYVVQGIASEKIRMPHQEPKLTHNRIQNIIYWIEAGAKKD